MLRSLAALLLLAASPPAPPTARRTLTVKNLGAAPVTLLLQFPDQKYAWGPYELSAHEELHVDYCPCAALTLELRSTVRAKPLLYPLKELTRLLLSEDRWSQGDPITVATEETPSCQPGARCLGPPFRIRR